MMSKSRFFLYAFSLATLTCALCCSLVTPSLAEAQSLTADDFLQASGKDLVYQGENVVLKGTNFANIPALGASIGSGNINDMRINELDYQELRAQGGNHVRLGLSFNWYQDNRTQFFQVMDQHIEWARTHNVWIILNMFTTPGDCYEGYGNTCGIWASSSEQDELRDFWVDVAQQYYDEPVIAGYGLLNEPTPSTNCSAWFTLAGSIYSSVNTMAPNQLVFIATCSDPGNNLRYNSPPTGANIVYEVHDYTPSSMTHSTSATYPGTASAWFGTCTYNKNAFQGISEAGDPGYCADNTNLLKIYGHDWATTNNKPMYVGEWGAVSQLTGYLQFHQDKSELYRDWGMNTAHYTWKHKTKLSSSGDQWGIYSNSLGITLADPEKLDAVKISWENALFPAFTASTPSPTPSPTPTPTSESVLNSSPFSAPGPAQSYECANEPPSGAPDLFQINRTGKSAKLYFTPANDRISNYHVIYGYQENQPLFGLLSAPVALESNNGVQSVTINELDPKNDYSFRIIPVNGCATGTWSNWLSIRRSRFRESIFYRYLPTDIKKALS